MNINHTLQTDVLDILFANRNKSYGAYQLRKNYGKRLFISLLVMMGICLFSSAIFKWTTLHQTASSSLFVSDEINLTEAKTKEQPPVQPPVKLKSIEKPQMATLKFTTPKLVNEDAPPPPTQADVTDVKIDIETKDGTRGDIITPPMEQSIGAGESLVRTEDYTKEFHTVQRMAQFPGGQEAWANFLRHNLRSETPADNGAPAGNYTVNVSFLVDREGSISEVKAMSDPGYGTAAEAVRVIQRGPQWQPAEQNGRSVIYRQIQQITFVVAAE